MNPTEAPVLPTASAPLAATLRALGQALGRLTDFQAFQAALQRAVASAELLPDLGFELAPGGGPQGGPTEFDPGRLNVPVIGRSEIHGVLRVARRDPERRFGPEDLHVLTALGAFIAAAADQAIVHRDALRQLDLLRFVLDLAPAGFLVFDGEARPLVVNAAARRWLGESPAVDPATLLSTAPAAERAARAYLRIGGKLLSAETVSAPPHAGRGAARVVVLADLTPAQTTLLEALARELYRTRCEGKTLSFALLEHMRGTSLLLARLPDLAANLEHGAVCGPYDAHRIAFVFPGEPYGAALRQLRRLRPLVGEGDVAAALVTAHEAMTGPEAVLGAALDAMRPIGRLLRPAVLLHDDYPAVNDTLELVLKRDFEVTKSSRLADTRSLLGQRHFDALVTELDLLEGASGLELAREARRRMPAIRTVFTTAASRARRTEDDPLVRQSAVFGKPFAVGEVLAHLQATLLQNPAE